MWPRIALLASLCLVASTAAAQPNGSSGRSTLLTRQQWVRFDVVLGRLAARHLRGGHELRTREAADETEYERLTVNGDASLPSVRYELRDAHRTVLVESLGGNTFTVASKPRSESLHRSVEFRQRPGIPLQLAILGTDGSFTSHQAESLWHLLLREPELCRDTLLPLMDLMRADWRLEETASDIEAELFRHRRPAHLSRSEVLTLVADLDSPQFRDRQAADRQMRSYGVAILPYLDQVDVTTLSAEQRLRLDLLRRQLRPPAQDSPVRVAAWLSHDKAIWLDLLAHRQPEKRLAAAAHLAEIHPGQIQFDAFADEPRRNAQIARLRSRLASY